MPSVPWGGQGLWDRFCPYSPYAPGGLGDHPAPLLQGLQGPWNRRSRPCVSSDPSPSWSVCSPACSSPTRPSPNAAGVADHGGGRSDAPPGDPEDPSGAVPGAVPVACPARRPRAVPVGCPARRPRAARAPRAATVPPARRALFAARGPCPRAPRLPAARPARLPAPRTTTDVRVPQRPAAPRSGSPPPRTVRDARRTRATRLARGPRRVARGGRAIRPGRPAGCRGPSPIRTRSTSRVPAFSVALPFRAWWALRPVAGPRRPPAIDVP